MVYEAVKESTSFILNSKLNLRQKKRLFFTPVQSRALKNHVFKILGHIFV